MWSFHWCYGILFIFFLASLSFLLQTDDNDAIHVISVADPPTVEKPPEYDTVVILDPPCYDEAIKLNPANLLQTKYYQDVSLPNYADLEISRSINGTTATITTSSSSGSGSSNNSAVASTDLSQPNGVITTTMGTANNNSNSISQTNENVSSNGCNTSTVITIEQTASDLTNEHSITRKSSDCDSIASESSVVS